jgi:hypothetical protein
LLTIQADAYVATVKIPVLAIFGNTVEELGFPYQAKSVVGKMKSYIAGLLHIGRKLSQAFQYAGRPGCPATTV